MVITRKLAFISLLLLSTSAFADANDGEYLGFRLGSKFSAPDGAIGRDHIMGALVYVVDPHQRHQHMGSLSIYVSPKSSIIGSVFGDWYFSSKRSAQQFSDRYMQTLETKYSNWKRRRNLLTHGDYQIWVDLEQKPPIVDHWPSDKKFRVSVAMVFAPESTARSTWMARVMSEAKTLEPHR
jgi:hypothetical protein